MYTFDSRVRYSETDENGTLSIDGIINYMQDCTNFESEDLGAGDKFLKEKQIMWVLNSWQIVIRKYPYMGEHIKIGTQAYGFEKMFGYRNFLITDSEDNTIAIANSIWVLMDLKKNRPMIVPDEIGNIYGNYSPLEMDYAPRKIKLPSDGTSKEPITVHEYHLDTNHHVNNGQYVKMAMSCLGADSKVSELRVEYKKQALLGDIITPVIYEDNNSRFVALNDESGKPYAIVQFIYQ